MSRAATISLVLGMAACADRSVPQNDESVGERASQDTVAIFLSRAEMPVRVLRVVPATEAPLGSALRALVNGPTKTERESGLDSWFSKATAAAIASVTIDAEGRAVIDLQDLRQIIPGRRGT